MFIKNFTEISKNDAGIAGGKGASLGELTRAGITVPSGFVILASAYERFLAETDLLEEVEAQLNKVNYEDVNSVDGAANILRNLIQNANTPKDLEAEILASYKKLGANFVAVRSSATAEDSSTASWAGELESYLNTTEEKLLENVKKCWSSLFTPRAIFYRHEQKLLKSKVSVAVVVQKMVESEVAGVCFTVHPVTRDKNQMIIEAVYGLGETLVSGEYTPDTYIIEKSKFKNQSSKIGDCSILDINISEQKEYLTRARDEGNVKKETPRQARNKQKLSGKEIIELAKICTKIEDHYRFPCDIEWAKENAKSKNQNAKFYIVQSRPITTL